MLRSKGKIPSYRVLQRGEQSESSTNSESSPKVTRDRKAPLGNKISESANQHFDDWQNDYKQSQWWGEKWEATQVSGRNWPQGIQIHGGKMVWDGRVCVPESRVDEVIQTYHEFMGHAGAKKVAKEVGRRYVFPGNVSLWDKTQEVRRRCATCQACEPPNWNTKLPLSYTRIPPDVMSSVSLDIFSLPPATWQ